ncbi:acyl-CoA thioester hydrolase, YbgC/YbaW family [Thermanaerovibrio velox DSM 12556]|uniref:Acyl-CoA thioester hydrolase, YbgC/YbaW family n=1 Tax=Thermanaerovibrio velox DSM 12556 TaxID=926567 RepID=H0USM5_9BACT|nr:thioesterase family protein [Thermanaerovibrio velox]EHM10314.1 acyl-CoA thioester hydrolase, YbgC/YbaW family [Thermanaerovibrio velox DSM 12556]
MSLPFQAVQVRVRYSETDQMGIAYHANYLVWFEVARGAFCEALGISYREWEGRGILLPAVEARCRYKRPARYDDVITVECRLKDLSPHSVTFSYRVLLDQVLLAEGTTKHGICDRAGRLMTGDNPFYLWLKERINVSGG